MGDKSTRRRLNRLLNDLDTDGREQLLEYAKRLSDADRTAKGASGNESLVPNDGTPSYTAAFSESEYNRRRQKAERENFPNDMTP